MSLPLDQSPVDLDAFNAHQVAWCFHSDYSLTALLSIFHATAKGKSSAPYLIIKTLHRHSINGGAVFQSGFHYYEITTNSLKRDLTDSNRCHPRLHCDVLPSELRSQIKRLVSRFASSACVHKHFYSCFAFRYCLNRVHATSLHRFYHSLAGRL